jgi:cardiolipin synthase
MLMQRNRRLLVRGLLALAALAITGWLAMAVAAGNLSYKSILVVLGLVHPVAFAAVALHCLRNRRETAAMVAWLFVAWSFPFIGPLLYMAFGINRVHTKGWQKQRSNDVLLSARREREDASLPLEYWRALRVARAGKPDAEYDRELDGTIDRILPHCPLLGGNRIEPLLTGDEAFPRMLDAIDRATSHIHLQAFIIGNDSVGREFLDRLKRKAEAGVRCRVLYDRFGSTRGWAGGLFKPYRNTPGLDIAGWTQTNPIKRLYQFNLRNHRKVLIVDGKEAFIGGLNLHEGNVTRSDRQPIRDYHFAVAGPIALELQYAFLQDWYFMTDEDPAALLTADLFPRMEPVGDALIRVANGGPTADVEALTDITCAAIDDARKQLLIVTPYFVPPTDILRALRLAARRGVSVQIVVPKKNNHFYAGLAGQALYDQLLSAGVQIYEREPPFMHAKSIIVDNRVSIVGTANLDNRSLRLNYETNLVVFDEPFANALKRIVLEDMAQSEELELAAWRSRPTYRPVAENLCSLLAPVL